MSINAPSTKDEEGLTLAELLRSVKSAWRWLLSGASIGLLGAVIFALVTPAQYEAVAIIHPATVGMYNATASNTNALTIRGVEVESAAQVLERLKFVTFYADSLVEVCRAGSPKALAGAVHASLVKGNSLIQIGYRADTPATAEACLFAIVNHLAKSQANLAEPLIITLQEQHKLTKQRLDEVEYLNAQAAKQGTLPMSLSSYDEASQLRRTYNEQSLQLSSAVTQPVRLFEPIYTSENAVFPDKKKIVLIGLFGGLILGCIAFLVRRSWTRHA